MKKEHVIIYSFQSLDDPLMKGLMLEYIKKTDPKLNLHFHLITHEQKHFSLNEDEKNKKKYRLFNENNISWHPVNYHSGKFILLKKIFDFLKTLMICLQLKREYGIKTILGFLPIAGGYSAIISKLFRLKLVVYCFEPHSEYLADFGTWKRSSVKYKLLNFFERFQVKNADYLIVPTSHTELLVKKIKTKGKLFVCPISVDTELMHRDETKREEIRKSLNVGDKKIIIYTGKFNGIYYPVSVLLSFFEKLNSDGNYFLFIISPDFEEVKMEFEGKIKISTYGVIPPVPYEKLHHYISSADLGIVAVPPFPSQKYRTPVKTGIYLACGLPYLVNRGIAEDDMVAENENVGVVTENFEESDLTPVRLKIEKLLSENKGEMIARCRTIAEKTRDTKIASGILNEIFSDIYSR